MNILLAKFVSDSKALIALLLSLWAATVLSMWASTAQAQTPAPDNANAALYASAQHWLDESLIKSAVASPMPLRMEVLVGALDSRLKLAPCQQVEPYLPVGTRLWGKTRLGLRCVQGATRWNVFLPITVKAHAMAWVIKGNVAPGTVLTESHAMASEVDWAELTSPIVANAADWLGHTATRMLTTGQALRQDMVRSAQVFQAGAQVRVLAQGGGFEIATSGQAMSAGVVGESAKVRMDSGRMMNGMVIDDRTVRLAL